MFGSWLVDERPPADPDCLIVPSYALKDRRTPTRMTCAQIEMAVDWQRRFPQAKVIFSTGDTQGLGVADAAVMARYACQLGLPQEAAVEEGQSTNTYENLVYSCRLAKQMACERPALVLYDLHARRVLAIARKMGWIEPQWISASSPGEGAQGIKWLRTFSRPAILLYELLGMVYSKLRGWV
jgi:uncharacterized SAM-binding protein YcdF (DUF218 family)